MLTTYKFGKQPTKEKMDSEEDDETDAEDEKVFEHVELAYVQHRIFTIASAEYVHGSPVPWFSRLPTLFYFVVTLPSATAAPCTIYTASSSK